MEENLIRFKGANSTLYVGSSRDEDGELFLGIDNTQFYLDGETAKKLSDHIVKAFGPKEKPIRENGFYWVRVAPGSSWEIAMFNLEGGWIFGTCFVYEDFFHEIDERRIERVE